MNLLPFLLGATILFWGWQAGFWMIAIPLAIAYEAARYINWRWNLTTAEFRQTSHVCTVLLVGVLIYLFISDRNLGLIFSFFQWLPVICAPLLLAQAYSTSDRVDLNALLFFKDKPNRESFLLDLTYPYLAICILAASAANNRGWIFYGCIVILISCALIPTKSTRFSPAMFVALLLLASMLGFAGHVGLHQFQLSLARNTARFFYGFYRPQSDPNQISTAIGDIGSVKQSNEIVLRVKPAPKQVVPKLLRQATYNNYSSGFWVAAQPEFTKIASEELEKYWILTDSPTSSSKVNKITVSEYLDSDDGDTLLKLPDGSFQSTKFSVEEIKQNQYGTVQALTDESFLSYQIQYDPHLSGDSPPTKDDLKVVKAEQPAINRVIAELNLTNKTPQEILNTVDRFFNTEFDYSLELARQGNNKTPLAAFLLQNRSGHCEYFATATALLLRSVGIPTRYAVGYSVQELSKLERQYIVRSRNAHAWTQVYINNHWIAFDTTPASWIAFENRRNSNSWQDILDIFSWMKFKFSQAIAIFKNLGKGKYLWLLALPLAFILIREFTNKGAKRRLMALRINQKDAANLAIGADSELYLIEQELNKLGLKRDRWQTWQDWLIQLQDSPETSNVVDGLEPIVKLHYRYRFDPQGINPEERAKLRLICNAWLEQHKINRQLAIPQRNNANS